MIALGFSTRLPANNPTYSELFLIASSPRGRPALPGALHLPHWKVIAAANVSLRDLRQQVVAIFCTAPKASPVQWPRPPSLAPAGQFTLGEVVSHRLTGGVAKNVALHPLRRYAPAHLRAKSRRCAAVALRNAPAGAALATRGAFSVIARAASPPVAISCKTLRQIAASLRSSQ